jgi:hypothetical protein
MLYYAMGDALVEHDELVERLTGSEMQRFADSPRAGPGHTLTFSTGVATRANLLSGSPQIGPEHDDRTAFTPIGLGVPLTIELRHIYTGKEPRATFFQKSKDMIVTSAMKGFTTYTSAPRAVNMLERAVGPQTNLRDGSATSPGTPLIFYVPAMTQAATTLTIDVMFDNFPEQIFTTIGSAFQTAAGIPIFASASVYLLAAGMITKVIGAAGHGLFDGRTGFRTTDTITFARPGAAIRQADYRLLTQAGLDVATLKQHQLNNDGALVDAQGNAYNGDVPYVVISLDGQQRREYEGFQPTAASAALLDQFFTIKDGTEHTTQTLLDAMRIYNDWKYRKEADGLKEDLAKATAGTPEYGRLAQKLKASQANILNKELQLNT